MGSAGFKRGPSGEHPSDLLAKLGPTLLVDIGLKSRSPLSSVPDLPKKKVKALIDTGAGGDCIDDALARELRLPVTEEGEISGVGGRHHAYMYTARLYVPSMKRLVFQQFAGVRLQDGDQWHRVILGRTFLRMYRLTYDGTTGMVELEDPGAPERRDR